MGRVWSAVRAFRETLHNEPESAKPRPASWLEKGELPESYGRTKVVAMPVSPYLIHVYWDLQPDQRTEGPASLRFHDTTSGGSFDVNVDLAAKNWYVHVWSPEKRYSVELVANREGSPVPLARSNPVETPRAWPVAEVREQFIRVPPPLQVEATAPAAISGTAPPLPASQSMPIKPPEPERPAEPVARPILSPRPNPAPVNAIEVLRQRLAELYAFRRWRPQPRPGGEDAASGEAAVSAEGQRPRLLDVIEAGGQTDVTSRVEGEFSPGLSSILLALSTAKKPAG